jgi:hypothetical protein
MCLLVVKKAVPQTPAALLVPPPCEPPYEPQPGHGSSGGVESAAAMHQQQLQRTHVMAAVLRGAALCLRCDRDVSVWCVTTAAAAAAVLLLLMSASLTTWVALVPGRGQVRWMGASAMSRPRAPPRRGWSVISRRCCDFEARISWQAYSRPCAPTQQQVREIPNTLLIN